MKSIEKNTVTVREEDYKVIEAEFFESDFIIESDYINYRIDKNGQRFYVRCLENGLHIVAPSFTELIRSVNGMPKELAYWMADVGKEQSVFESTNSAAYGTFLHCHFAHILRGESVLLNQNFLLNRLEDFCEDNGYHYNSVHKWYKQKSRKIVDDTLGFICWIRDFKVKPIAMEYPLMHPAGLWAGTCDLVCRITIDHKEIIALVDIKSTLKDFYEDNEIQLHAYRLLWDMENIQYPIEKIFNLGCNSFRKKTLHKYLSGGKSGKFRPYSFKDQTESENLYKWATYVELYHKDSKNMKFENTFEYDEILSIDKDSDLSNIISEYNIIDDITKKDKDDEEQNAGE